MCKDKIQKRSRKIYKIGIKVKYKQNVRMINLARKGRKAFYERCKNKKKIEKRKENI